MKWVILPEPGEWVAHLPELLGRGGAAARVLAPWALPGLPSSLVPASLRAAVRRRQPEVPQLSQVVSVPGWTALEAGLRAWGSTPQARLRARFAVRQGISRLAALRPPASLTRVVAPSLAAREVFVAARARGARCVLVEDLPNLRALHADLDEAFARHPEEHFLRNHRASARDVARQEAERLLADEIWVRGDFAREQLLRAGLPAERTRELHPRAEAFDSPREDSPAGHRVTHLHRVALLAGPALARMGAPEALAALEARPEWTLWVRPSEDSDLMRLEHPRVRVVTRQQQQALDGVDAVLAPAWCESHPPELARAITRGIPVIATDRAAGFLPCRTVPRGNVPALVAELDALTPPRRGALAQGGPHRNPR
ncbi:hypothetical protein DRW03_04760 [Corallococcus sp. H22C18031201]|uniref:hypothetical protein n=1 Tax=Citreicoccus inhibens TaxID=2849499 RepID=UPI000E7645E2|nr:hypothetical protein [Citreicoccus inhibens]MBU8899315.1 hypothetical protein [Citreicoccus inhibens]RJS25790.1 hypothetical protein DRW03_04760 [Corallococcus sp. H22C18031201]